MADKVSTEELANSMYKLIKEYAGKKRFKAPDLTKEMVLKYGEDKVSKDDAKGAIRILIDSGRCIYAYYGGGTFIILPTEEVTL